MHYLSARLEKLSALDPRNSRGIAGTTVKKKKKTIKISSRV